jgi:exopolysaccharide biosynthesis polyprenyl glycosylphosphotransferase
VPKRLEKILLLLTDYVSITCAFLLWAWLRKEMGLYIEANFQTLLYISLLVFALWIFIFMFFGLYRSWYAQSRFDEVITIFKTISFGVLVIFLITFDTEKDLTRPPTAGRMFIINYWLVLLISVISFRMLFRSIQRGLIIAGVGNRRTLIVGSYEHCWELATELSKFPALGYRVVGFVRGAPNGSGEGQADLPQLGQIDEINNIIVKEKIEEIIFALKGDSRKKVMEVVGACDGMPVNFKIVPELYDIIIGQARVNQIYGFPLIDILPQFMPEWERKVKRLMDVSISFIILAGFAPIWLLVAIAIKIDSRGPVLYKQLRVGKDSKEFTIYKFRSMVEDAESMTGPKWAEKADARITRIGNLIRRARIDEVPQFYNVLVGEMSLIGPRPERPFFVEKFKQQIPFYSRRLKVKPGITGWAQIKGGYDSSIENVKTKLQFDLFYLENMSLRMDLKILINTFYVMLLGKGQ